MADGVIALSQALVEFRKHGVISVATKAAGAERMAQLVELHLRGDLDLNVARRQGREILKARLDADHLDGAAASDAAIDALFFEVISMVKTVSKLVGADASTVGH
jgi:hypothetical protein